jgi:predicted DNA-binding transcriptional regulator YafY
MRRTDRLFEII